MIINDNIATEIGDVIEFTTVPLFNITRLRSFNDSVTGLAPTRYFDKTFCYSLDGVAYTEFEALNLDFLHRVNANLTTKGFLILKFRYKRSGTDTTGQLGVDAVNVDAVYSTDLPDFYTTSRTPFAQLAYDDINVWNMAINLAMKMYEEGIVPVYLNRAEEADNIVVDADYIDFWEIVGKLFALVLIDSFKLTVIYWRKELLAEYLKQRGIVLATQESIVSMQMIAKHFYDEARQRGTHQIFAPAQTEYPMGSRNVYESPYGATEVLRPSLYTVVDGVKYDEISALPDGWAWVTGASVSNVNGLLIAPDTNYHDVQFLDVNGDLMPALSMAVLLSSMSTGVYKKYDGEYLRLIDYKPGDEFIYNLPERKHTGWCLGNSSPMYRGLRPQQNRFLIKVYQTWQ